MRLLIFYLCILIKEKNSNHGFDFSFILLEEEKHALCSPHLFFVENYDDEGLRHEMLLLKFTPDLK